MHARWACISTRDSPLGLHLNSRLSACALHKVNDNEQRKMNKIYCNQCNCTPCGVQVYEDAIQVRHSKLNLKGEMTPNIARKYLYRAYVLAVHGHLGIHN